MPNDNEIQVLIRQLDWTLATFLTQHLVPYGLTGQQGRVLGFIYDQEKAGIPICQVDVEAELDITGSSVTSLLQGLESKGFILRRTRASDNRAKELFLTEKARALIDEFEQVFQEAEERLLQGFSPEERKFLAMLLAKALRNMG
jgi:DNA-binding MarR family transcriptional regulator